MTTTRKQLEKDLEEVRGDSTLYAGMLAYVGDTEAATYTSKCVDLTGQIWRYPDAQYKGQYVNSCSRDMFMGVLLGGDKLAILTVANYLKFSKGLLCPKATDNRNKVGVMGWAQLGVVLGKDATPEMMGLKGYLSFLVGKPLLGLVTAIEALTVYEKYQLNLVYCALMLLRRHGGTIWDKSIMWILKNLRRCDEAPYYFLEGNLEKLDALKDTARENRNKMLGNSYQHVADWPPNNGHLGHAYPSEVYCVWLELACKYLRDRKPV